ncbi:PREDICTED: complement C3, partial [Chaetura pelagica]
VTAKALPQPQGKQFVSVTAQVGQVTLEKVLLLSLQSGHIFVQTDKPIYTPSSTVLCRLFAVNHLMEPAAKTVIVEIKTPDNVIIKQVPVSSPMRTGIFSLNHNLPEVVSLGMWTIMAKFEDSPDQVFSTQFEVKEYVLPSFEVVLDPEEKFLYIDQEEDFRVSITARYLYGKRLEGTAFVLFGVLVDDEKKSIPQSLKRIQVIDGDGEAVLPMAVLRQRFANPQELVGHSLYVTVTVLTESGSDMVEAQRGGIRIVTSPYTIHFTHTPKYFKPGMPFDLTVYVTNPDESPAPRVTVQADGFQGLVSTQRDGTAKLVLNMPANKDSVPITPSMDTKITMVAKSSMDAKTTMVAKSSIVAQPSMVAKLSMEAKTSTEPQPSIDTKTTMVAKPSMETKLSMAAQLPLVAQPFMDAKTTMMAKSFVPTMMAKSPMDAKTTMLVVKGATEGDNRVQEPGTPMRLRIEGDHNARVGLVAVDKGVFVLNKKNKLTQAKLVVKGATEGYNRVSCPQPAKRKRRSLQLVEDKNNKGEEDDIFLDEEHIISRTLFPESWLWQLELLSEKPDNRGISKKTVPIYLKDTITTWEVLGISLSPTKDLCVLQVRVELMHNPSLCSASTSKQRYQQIIKVKGQSSWAVPFVIVPLQLGLQDVEVKAAVRGKAVADGVKKKLKVVPEGMRLEKTVTIVELDPKTKGVNGVQEEKVRAANLSDIVPNTESETKVSIQGNPMSIMVEKAIDGEKLKHLITTPAGCGEQNMIGMTPTVIATHYLDSTQQWESFGVDQRAKAIELIKKGYTQQLAFRKPDSSYAAFNNLPSSTWLTAYVAKVFAMAIKLVDIEPEVICGAVKWLILEKQKPDGIFQEDAPVIHKEMVGGYHGAEPEVSLTAFVLVALQEAREVCKDHINSLDGSINKAADYLARRYQSLGRPYTVALSSYALALTGKLKSEKVLMKFSKGGRSWEERNALTYNIEGTSYALLALLQMEKTELTGPVARWLAQQNYFGGGYGSTQVGYRPCPAPTGYTQQLAFRKPDSSYAAFNNLPSSTWLTAYVAKVFAMAIKLVDIEPEGGYHGAEPEVSLTAFVLVALQEAREVCKDHINSLDGSINKAADYLARRYQSLGRPYTVALSSYALALTGKLKSEKVLMKFSKGGRSWEERNALTYNIEGTSYALLALLQMEKTELTGPVARWLAQQNYFGGGYGSTQPNSLVAPSAKTKLNEDFTVKAEGTGKGTLTVVTVYNAKVPEKDNKCDSFDLQVDVEEVKTGKEEEGVIRSIKINICAKSLETGTSGRDIREKDGDIRNIGDIGKSGPSGTLETSGAWEQNGDTGDIKEKDGDTGDKQGSVPPCPMGVFENRDIRDGDVGSPRVVGNRDIGLAEGVDRYISKFELDKEDSERSNVVIYLNKISHQAEECFSFRAHQRFQVGLIQPASVTVYSYYKIDDRCTRFYHPDRDGGQLSKICHGDVCRCAEGDAGTWGQGRGPPWAGGDLGMSLSPVYKVKLVAVEQTPSHDNYIMNILSVIKM